MPAVLGGEDGAAGSGSGDVLPAAADGVFRGTGLGARDGVAGGGLAGAAEFSADRAGGSAAGSLDDLADAAADRRGDAPGSVHVGAGSDCGEGIAARQDAGNRRHDAGGQRSTAKHRAAGQRGKLPGVSHQAGEGVGHRDADAGRSGATGPEAEEEEFQSGLGAPARSRRADHEDERWPDAPGAQGGARGGFGDRSGGGSNGARGRSGRHHHAARNVRGSSRAVGGGGERTGSG